MPQCYSARAHSLTAADCSRRAQPQHFPTASVRQHCPWVEYSEYHPTASVRQPRSVVGWLLGGDHNSRHASHQSRAVEPRSLGRRLRRRVLCPHALSHCPLPPLAPSCRPRWHAHQRGPHSEAARCHKLKDKKALITVAANGLDCVVRFGPTGVAPGWMRFSRGPSFDACLACVRTAVSLEHACRSDRHADPEQTRRAVVHRRLVRTRSTAQSHLSPFISDCSNSVRVGSQWSTLLQLLAPLRAAFSLFMRTHAHALAALAGGRRALSALAVSHARRCMPGYLGEYKVRPRPSTITRAYPCPCVSVECPQQLPPCRRCPPALCPSYGTALGHPLRA